MNLLNIPPSGTRSLDAMRRELEVLESDTKAMHDKLALLRRTLRIKRTALKAAERKALRRARK